MPGQRSGAFAIFTLPIMRIYNAKQIRAWDAFTIREEPISSLNLMERAAAACTEWIRKNTRAEDRFLILCGKGNNGGDGLAIARMLFDLGRKVRIFVLETPQEASPDFSANIDKIFSRSPRPEFTSSDADFPKVHQGEWIIDALYGTGLNRPLAGFPADLVSYINEQENEVISIDIPSGMLVDSSSRNNIVIKAWQTLSFQTTKLAFLVAENAPFLGKVEILDIGLRSSFKEKEPSRFELVEPSRIFQLIKDRDPFAHKGTYGHAALLAGSYGMMGAAILSAGSCLRSGVGKLTCYVPSSAHAILQVAVPEAILHVDKNENRITEFENAEAFQAIGVGPGIGTFESNAVLLEKVFVSERPLVIDADALNTIALHPRLLEKIPRNSLLSPHPKELERLFGKPGNDFERIEMVMERANSLGLIIILKGHYSLIALPGNRGFFNPTGNAGMAKAGSGDVLTGLLTGLLARGYQPEDASLLGVYLHGLAGDLAARELGEESMTASDLISWLPKAFLSAAKTLQS